jgi:hypothetical protein
MVFLCVVTFLLGAFLMYIKMRSIRDADERRFIDRMTRMNQKYQAAQLEIIRMQRGAVLDKSAGTPS